MGTYSSAYTGAQLDTAVGRVLAGYVDTSDATATAADIMSGKTAYAGGVKLTGTATSGAGPPPTPGNTPVKAAYTVVELSGSGTYASGVTLTLVRAGTYRIKWFSVNGSSTGSTRLHKNGTEVPGTTMTATTTPQAHSVDVAVAAGDIIEIYGSSGSSLRDLHTGLLVACIDWANGY